MTLDPVQPTPNSSVIDQGRAHHAHGERTDRMTSPGVSLICAQRAAVFLLIGGASVIAGGLTAAITAPAPSEHATWAAAYLVLVAGVAQIGLGAGRAWLAERTPSTGRLVAELGTWNLGNAAVIGGTVSGLTAVVDLGGGLLFAASALLLAAVRNPRRSGWPLTLYRALIVIVLASIPIGLTLAALKTG